MSQYTTSEFDLLIQKATSESIPNGELDLPVALEISDIIRSRKLKPLECMRCLKKRIGSTLGNPNTQLSSWKLLDVCIKNGGTPFIVTICSREFMDTIEHTIIRMYDNRHISGDDELYELVTKIFYELYLAFKSDSQLHYVSTVYSKLTSRGIKFPEHLVDTNSPMIMFDSKTPADWVDSDACMICSKRFSMINRRHHCRSCGGIFCQEHSSHVIPLPDLGITEEVRVCDNCFEDYDMKKRGNGGGSGSNKKKHSRKHGKKNKNNEDDEDEQLKRAIELSLQESNTGSTEPIIPVVEPENSTYETEDDQDLKAAIEESLREAEAAKAKNNNFQKSQQTTYPQFQQQQPNNDLTASEEEDIYMFASLVEKMKTQTVTDILDDVQLQKLYQKVVATKPKLNHSLNDKINKYNTLIDMNAKISDIMNIYDSLLEQQLRKINISQQYNLAQQPSDPYAITQQLPAHPQPAQHAVPQVQSVMNETVIEPHVPVQPVANPQQYVQTPVENISQPILPSEPPYPEENEFSPKKNETQHAEPEADLNSGKPPYPIEANEQTATPKEVDTPANIVTYDFPAVPASKLPHTTTTNSVMNDSVPVGNKIGELEEEELLLEL
ncbi:similar to Saccharomyces cerevisiae YNR006W VPS27 Endosomal protein that forms a complex with Hse1p [Maudiozyma barnettii]|uniref:Vacuolar protein sorting-associated protein 27 n=1 Tax=Maudiozyma barnettii TaxID=61262 RepID=A0A8H2VGZ6_9SACH|nr:ESCRT-0 subunit protein VPS27 [Kazachstania barnettii]CAB4255395.1 similar to Saccharomyces cerevisiae YNR006W VPS27 Endosomal protein that forms a complex with Hse1p [Kazachstania barnettii]CAD1783801.1 similar to Saccharomyces cerevisiae YNR006W VPS27 Endosomal protein that forms a complex with Hse1p [Kazachstania barnettii]